MTEEDVRGLFSAFENKLDPDIESFIRDKAQKYQRRGWSSVYFIVDYDKVAKGEPVVEAYFTLSHKAIALKDEVSKSQRKKIFSGVIKDDPFAHFVLIGHLGKFIGESFTSALSVKEILGYAWEIIAQSRDAICFSSILVECKDEPKLIEKYIENGFTYLQEDELVQLMLRV